MLRRNSVTVEDAQTAVTSKLEKKHKPEKLFLRSSSVGLTPGPDEQSPSASSSAQKSPNRRESIKGHLLKFKAKAEKILEEVQNSKNLDPEASSHGNNSFISQGSELETMREELVVDEQAVSETSSQQGASLRKESRDQMRHRIRQNAQKAVERTRGNVQLNRRLARRPTVVIEELVDQNDIEAIDEQIEKTIKIGEKFMKEKRNFEDFDRKNDEFFERKNEEEKN
ncbi:unnamed protein product [Caenorhabditis angaria]|uniref:Uncharacterized protein n=1 Tax=Caenorhabditis angaria TaxID=860376 RepID=A0A9P1MU50_9PELO|nr:unnamed protein product [Caenorhabditis angaria]